MLPTGTEVMERRLAAISTEYPTDLRQIVGYRSLVGSGGLKRVEHGVMRITGAIIRERGEHHRGTLIAHQQAVGVLIARAAVVDPMRSQFPKVARARDRRPRRLFG